MYDIVHQDTHGIKIDDDGHVKDTNKSSTESVWTTYLIEKRLKDESISHVCEDCDNE